jgi:hypothetical protein
MKDVRATIVVIMEFAVSDDTDLKAMKDFIVSDPAHFIEREWDESGHCSATVNPTLSQAEKAKIAAAPAMGIKLKEQLDRLDDELLA